MGGKGGRKLEVAVNAGVKKKTEKSGHKNLKSRAVHGDLIEWGQLKSSEVQHQFVD